MKLTVGFAQTDFSGSIACNVVDVPSGQYHHYVMASVDFNEVDVVWQKIFAAETAPSTVIERYTIDTMGEVQETQIQALFE